MEPLSSDYIRLVLWEGPGLWQDGCGHSPCPPPRTEIMDVVEFFEIAAMSAQLLLEL